MSPPIKPPQKLPQKLPMKPHERGVALLTVLLMVAVMAAIAVGVMDDIRFGLRRTLNAQAGGQAQYFALGAEALARARISRLLDRDSARTTLEGGWNGRPVSFPVEQGVILATVRDGTGCFNLNSVALAGGGEPFVRREAGVRQFAALLEALGVASPELLAEALADWIDTNAVGGPGLEDDGYVQGPRPYRTAGVPLAEVSELRAVRGFTPEVYARLRPWVCALPTTDLSPININTLDPERALLITAITDGQVPPANARSALAARPASGWDDLAEFWALPAFAQTPLDAPARSQLQLRSRYFTLEARVDLADSEARMTALFETPSGDLVRLVARRWTLDE
ncbi:MAG: type II secretion system minor pseudopilin GspK [Caulobacter sp.]